METEGSSDLHAQAVQGNAPQGGKSKSYGGHKQPPLAGAEALLSSLGICLHYPTALLPLLLNLTMFYSCLLNTEDLLPR